MSMHRMYTGDDGETHVEEIDLANRPDLANIQAATGIVFRSVPPDYFSDFHNAPRRQYIIIVEGGMEIELGDGSVHQFGPGSVVLAEDLTGRGHITRNVDGKLRISAQVPLAE
jgi:hypothetical protein